MRSSKEGSKQEEAKQWSHTERMEKARESWVEEAEKMR